MKNIKWLWLIIVLLFVACIYEIFMFSRAPSKSSMGSTAAQKNISGEKPSAPPVGVEQRTASASAQVRPNVNVNYYSSSDLSRLVNDLNGGVGKNGKYELMKAKATEECLPYVRQPNYANDIVNTRKALNKGIPDVLTKYADTLTQRCRNFVVDSSTALMDAKKLYSEAAKEGNPEAIAHQLRRDILSSQANGSLDELRTKSIDLIASGDPAAIFELGGAFGANSKLEGAAVGSEKATAAWQLVACDMGLDCSANSALLANFCINGGMYCEPGDLRYNMSQSAFSPTDFEEVISLEKKIYTQIKNGNIASLFN